MYYKLLKKLEVGVTSVQAIEGIELLILDDEPGVLRALSLLLQSYKCRVTALSSPSLLLEHLRSGAAPDLILSDLRMPEMSGIEVLSILRREGCNTPFILMSGHANEAERMEARKVGATGFLSKPFLPQELLALLSRSISGHNGHRRATG